MYAIIPKVCIILHVIKSQSYDYLASDLFAPSSVVLTPATCASHIPLMKVKTKLIYMWDLNV